MGVLDLTICRRLVLLVSGLDVGYQKHRETGRFGRNYVLIGNIYVVCTEKMGVFDAAIADR